MISPVTQYHASSYLVIHGEPARLCKTQNKTIGLGWMDNVKGPLKINLISTAGLHIQA